MCVSGWLQGRTLWKRWGPLCVASSIFTISCMCPLYQFKFRSVNFHMSSEQLRCKCNTLYPFFIFVSFRYSRPMGYFVSSRVVYRALIICLDIDECSNNTHNCHAKAVFIISRSLTVIDVKKVLREKDEISWLSSEWSLQYIFSNVAFLDYKPFYSTIIQFCQKKARTR